MIRRLVFGLATLSCAALALWVFQPVGIEAQVAASLAFVALMLLIRFFDTQGLARSFFVVLGMVVIGRYLYWRATATLPSIAQPVDFAFGIILFGAELLCITLFALNMFVVLRPLERPAAKRPADADAPSVDVFVPSLNESTELLAATLAAAKAMDYPSDRLTVYLLDDGGTQEKVASSDPDVAEAALARRSELQALCADLDVVYLTRERNVNAKAGNLTNGLAHSRGDLIAIFDADHAPSRDFLRKTVGYFAEDEKLFLVQTPHFFLNPDPIERNLSTFTKMPSENEMFYGLIQKGLDKWNAAFFCGSAAVLRRTALLEAGGFSGTSITEDAETALDLHARGWRSAYVDEPMIAGLQPETMVAFIGQRSRWCRGMLQILLLKNPLFKAGLTWSQKVCYLSSSMFWLFPLPRAVFLVAPLLYLFFGLQIYNATVDEFVAYTIVYLATAMIMQSYVYGRFRWPWISEIYEYVQTIYLLPAALSVALNPRKPKFNVTAKGVTIEKDVLSGVAWPYFAAFAVFGLGIVATVLRLEAEPDAGGLLTIVGAWNAFNFVIATVALGVVCERRERRGTQRVPSRLRGSFVRALETVPVIVEDVSLGGVRLRAAKGAILEGEGRLVLQGEVSLREQSLPVRIVNAQTQDGGRIFGAAYGTLSVREKALAARLVFSDISPLVAVRAARRRAHGIVATALRVASWSVREVFRAFGYALWKRGSRSRAAA